MYIKHEVKNRLVINNKISYGQTEEAHAGLRNHTQKHQEKWHTIYETNISYKRLIYSKIKNGRWCNGGKDSLRLINPRKDLRNFSRGSRNVKGGGLVFNIFFLSFWSGLGIFLREEKGRERGLNRSKDGNSVLVRTGFVIILAVIKGKRADCRAASLQQV